MDLQDIILAKHSKDQTNKILRWIGSNQDRFDQLFYLFLHDESIVQQRAAWAVSNSVIDNPSFIVKHFNSLLKKLREPGIHDAVKRNGIRLLEVINIPRKYQGQVMNICFDFVASPAEKPAVKAYSLTVLQNLFRQYPEIKNELKLLIESLWDNESPAFRSRAKKILKEFASKTP